MASPLLKAANLALLAASLASANTCASSQVELENQSRRIRSVSALAWGSGELAEMFGDDRGETASRLRNLTAATIQTDQSEMRWSNDAGQSAALELPRPFLAAFLAGLRPNSLISLSNGQLAPPQKAYIFCILCRPGGPPESSPTIEDIPAAPFDPLLSAGAGLRPGPAIETSPESMGTPANHRQSAPDDPRVSSLSLESELVERDAFRFITGGALFLSVAGYSRKRRR